MASLLDGKSEGFKNNNLFAYRERKIFNFRLSSSLP